MTIATLTVYEPSRTGDSKAYVAGASGGDQFPNDGNTFIHFKSTGAAVTVTVDSQKPCDQGIRPR